MEAKDYIALSASGLALIVSLANLYLTHLRRARVELSVGDKIRLYYFGEGNLTATLTASFANHGARTETLQRLALVLQRPDSRERYLLEPFYFEKVTASNDLEHEAEFAPISIPSRGTELRTVLFRASLERPSEFLVSRAGTYSGVLVGWLRNNVNPDIRERFTFEVSDEDVTSLAQYRAEQKTTLVISRLSRWRSWAAHWLTDVESAALE